MSEKENRMQLQNEIISEVRGIYRDNIKKIEENFHFRSDSDICQGSMVLVLGQYSTGKTSFIKKILKGEAYQGSRIGPEPTTDSFNAVMYNKEALGKEKRRRDGHIVAKLGTDDRQRDDFSGLSKFGDKFLNSFQVSFTDNVELEDLIIVDTPGIMPGQSDSRGYDFLKITRWFAKRSDLVIILFDAHKLVIEEDFLKVIDSVVEAMKGNQKKIRLVLNKVDDVATEDLLNVYGQLMWVLATSGKVLLNQVEVRIFVTAFDPMTTSEYDPIKARTVKDEADLLEEIASLPRNKAQRKISDLLSHLETLQVHMRVVAEFKKEIQREWWWQREERKAFILQSDMEAFIEKVCANYDLPIGNSPDMEMMKSQLENLDWSDLPSLSSRQLSNISMLTDKVLPDMLQRLEHPELRHKKVSWGGRLQSMWTSEASKVRHIKKEHMMMAMGISLCAVTVALMFFLATSEDWQHFFNKQVLACGRFVRDTYAKLQLLVQGGQEVGQEEDLGANVEIQEVAVATDMSSEL